MTIKDLEKANKKAKEASQKDISDNQYAVMHNSCISGSERQRTGVSFITRKEIEAVEKALNPLFARACEGKITMRQYYYTVWYCLLGEKVDQWLEAME